MATVTKKARCHLSKKTQCDECKRLRLELKVLARAVEEYITKVDQLYGEMTKGKDRGKELGAQFTQLETMLNRAKFYGLGMKATDKLLQPGEVPDGPLAPKIVDPSKN